VVDVAAISHTDERAGHARGAARKLQRELSVARQAPELLAQEAWQPPEHLTAEQWQAREHGSARSREHFEHAR
jgi:hypothetical protein